MQENKSNKNIILAAVISFGFMLLWQYFYEMPKQQEKAKLKAAESYKTENREIQAQKVSDITPPKASGGKPASFSIPADLVISSTKDARVEFENKRIKASINSVGLKLDNLELKDYKLSETRDISLLSPAETKESYFVQFGFTSNDTSITLPNAKTIWNVKKEDENIVATWKNPQNITFEVILKLDENYMFSVVQNVVNLSGRSIDVAPFTKIFRSLPPVIDSNIISHEGFIGYFGGRFNEVKYEKLEKVKRLLFSKEVETFWSGFSDKYWLVAFLYNNEVCISEVCRFISSDISLNNITEGGVSKFQTDFASEEVEIETGQIATFPSKVFVGAKELKLLDKYSDEGFQSGGKTYKIQHFDKAVDFGIFYFLTKPIFLLITFLNSIFHNFGFAIIMLTVIVKLILMPVANKSYFSMAKMKSVAPKIAEMRKTITDKLEFNRKMVELYKEKQINPLAGCLPIILQIPVFFALYKVLYISIEMRGAPFIFWIKDLSLKDPTSFFNMFGLLPYSVPSFLQIGILPILMGLTTYLQQSLSPRSEDKTQAMIMKWMPFILIFVFANFPAGIVLYWITNNIMSIAQQFYVEKIVLPRQREKGGLLTKERR